jgi:hypothetical protein
VPHPWHVLVFVPRVGAAIPFHPLSAPSSTPRTSFQILADPNSPAHEPAASLSPASRPWSASICCHIPDRWITGGKEGSADIDSKVGVRKKVVEIECVPKQNGSKLPCWNRSARLQFVFHRVLNTHRALSLCIGIRIGWAGRRGKETGAVGDNTKDVLIATHSAVRFSPNRLNTQLPCCTVLCVYALVNNGTTWSICASKMRTSPRVQIRFGCGIARRCHVAADRLFRRHHQQP